VRSGQCGEWGFSFTLKIKIFGKKKKKQHNIVVGRRKQSNFNLYMSISLSLLYFKTSILNKFVSINEKGEEGEGKN